MSNLIAAADRQSITINYRAENGIVSTRTVQPIALRRSKAGNDYLACWDTHRKAHRSFRLDRLGEFSAA
jgi:predicted DNA-binding transcriptional regulator YafY